MINFISVKCPECSANLSIEEGRNTAFCTYCGAKVLINNENEHIYRYVDDASIKRAETEHIVELKKMEIAEERRKSAEKKSKVKTIISIVLLVFGLVATSCGHGMMMATGAFTLMGLAYMWLYTLIINSNKEESEDPSDTKAKIPQAIQQYTMLDYQTCESIFRNAGFSNIQCIPLHDVIIGKFVKQDVVSNITIDGMGVSMKKYPKTSQIMIYYHSK